MSITRLDTSIGALVTSIALSHIAIAIRMHGARSRLQNRVFPWRRSTNAHAHLPAPQCAVPKPIQTPKSLNHSVGVGINTQHNRKPQKSAILTPSMIWVQFSHLQRLPRDESVVLHSSSSFSLLFTSPRLNQLTNVDSTSRLPNTATQFASLAGASNWQNSQHTQTADHKHSASLLLLWYNVFPTRENTTQGVISSH